MGVQTHTTFADSISFTIPATPLISERRPPRPFPPRSVRTCKYRQSSPLQAPQNRTPPQHWMSQVHKHAMEFYLPEVHGKDYRKDIIGLQVYITRYSSSFPARLLAAPTRQSTFFSLLIKKTSESTYQHKSIPM